jgi:hypothetical protein
MAPDEYPYPFFSPLFGREPVDGDDFGPQFRAPSPWDDVEDAANNRGLPIAHFLPHLSRRTQRILGELQVNSVSDVMRLTKEQIFSCHQGNETVVCEIRATILDPKGLEHDLG